SYYLVSPLSSFLYHCPYLFLFTYFIQLTPFYSLSLHDALPIYVSNFTDVDDKIIQAAKELKVDAPDVANRFIEAFFADTEALSVKKVTCHTRVMDNIPEIIEFVEALIAHGYAYEANGDVYYHTKKFKDYGKLSGITIDQLRAGASNRLGEEDTDKKEDPIDFALWKQAKPGEISWDSPWGQGRPGWHIEC